MNIKERLNRILSTLPKGVQLVAVSKFHPAERLQEAYDAGQRIFGESRPQEMVAKYDVLPKDIEWHMIGHLQTNKVKYIAPFVTMISSVDSDRLIEEIEKQAAKNNRTIDILLEVHVAQEETKSGWSEEELRAYLASGILNNMAHVRVRGVMTIASNTDDESVVRRDFETIRRIFNELKPQFGEAFDTLSIGMSDDYPIALEYGSTMVRIGTAIFGQREY
jgi:pyridoxal phosphate enzyme (YggS family)